MNQEVLNILKTIRADTNLFQVAEQIEAVYNKPFEGELLEAWESF